MHGLERLLSLLALDGVSGAPEHERAWRELHHRPDAAPLPERAPGPAAEGRGRPSDWWRILWLPARIVRR